ncbi:tetratricopeptide repeat protein [bacterium]|nr:tetratricopeptide repeat protein [bacterium]
MKKLFITLFILGGLFSGSAFAALKKDVEQATPDPVSEQAKILYAQNDIDGAMKILQDKAEDSRSAEDWLLMGNILQDKDKINEAVYMFNQAISVDPKYYKAHYNLGYIYMIQDKPNMALTEFKKSTKYKDDFSYGYYNIGCVYLKLKDYRNAKYNFFRAMDLKNADPNIYYNLAYSFKMLNKEKQAQIYLDLYNKLTENQ